MRGWSVRASLLATALLVSACGHTNSNGSTAGGGSAGGAGKGQGGSSLVGEAGEGVGAGFSTGAGGTGGGPMLPPDGVVPPAVPLSKLDLLLMIDNSRNTAEKTRLLGDAVNWLLTSGVTLSTDDVHVGVITSSLGAHGAAGTRDVCVTPDDDDHAHLIGSLRPNLTSVMNLGFLAWGPEAGASPTLAALAADLAPHLSAVGDQGCGYESSLEAWYRFLADPEPPLVVAVPAGEATASRQGVDDTLLAQRHAFLRPDSVLAIVLLSDENDCSLRDDGYGWLIARAMPMYKSTSQCQANPNDACCQSCAEQAANAGCPVIASDSECAKGTTLDQPGTDDLSLRCWEQKRRFGFDLLYPISRYRDALTRQTQFNGAGQVVQNPLFAGSGTRRHPSQIIYTGIVGVPWQDVADAASLTGTGLTLLTGAELTTQKRWAMMVGKPAASPPLPPSDPFLIESPDDRSVFAGISKHPITGDALVGADSQDPQANAINGHEMVNQGNRTLQHVCTFPRAQPKLCDQLAFDSDQNCQCFVEDAAYNSPLCQPPSGGPPGIMQYYDDAFPGLRHLQLQQALGDTAITASICPKVFDDAAPDYGYRPAMKALAARLERAFKP